MTMSFKDKLNKQFQNLAIEIPSVAKYIEHVYADYIELNALYLKDEVTIADIADKLKDVHDQNILSTDLIVNSGEIGSLFAEENDVIEERFISIFDVCRDRELLFEEEEYPFTIIRNQIKLKEKLSEKHKLYLLLLLCSNLNYFKTLSPELTTDFELLSFFSLKAFLPEKSVVKSFGKNSEFNGNAKKKITDLAKQLHINIDTDKIESISENNSQERGLDVIGWMPFKDNIPNMLTILCQCACGKDWYKKQFDTQRFKGYFHWHTTPIHAMFIPYSLGMSNGLKFQQHDEILKEFIFFDRKRIIEQFDIIGFTDDIITFEAVERSLQDRIAV